MSGRQAYEQYYDFQPALERWSVGALERRSVGACGLEGVATLHALTLHALRKKSGGPKLFLHDP